MPSSSELVNSATVSFSSWLIWWLMSWVFVFLKSLPAGRHHDQSTKENTKRHRASCVIKNYRTHYRVTTVTGFGEFVFDYLGEQVCCWSPDGRPISLQTVQHFEHLKFYVNYHPCGKEDKGIHGWDGLHFLWNSLDISRLPEHLHRIHSEVLEVNPLQVFDPLQSAKGPINQHF